MRVGIVGSRHCNGLTVDDIIKNIPKECHEIVSGGAIGVDTLAKEAAIKLNLPIKEFLPDYKTFGKKAPIIRNTSIVENSDMVIAFWDYKSAGTRNTLLQSFQREKKVKIIMI